jgi:uncharacterized protein YjdB
LVPSFEARLVAMIFEPVLQALTTLSGVVVALTGARVVPNDVVRGGFMQWMLMVLVVAVLGCGPKVTTLDVTPTTVLLTTQKPDRALVASAKDKDGNEVAEQSYAFSSASPEVVTCTPDGKLRAKSSGSGKIMVTVNGVEGVQAEVLVTVELVRSLRLGSPVEVMRVGESRPMIVAFLNDRGERVTPKDAAPTWKSSQPTIALVDGGQLKALAAGITTIEVSHLGMSATVSVTVNPALEAVVDNQK